MKTYAEIVNSRRVAFGPTDRLMTMAAIKYPWAMEIHDLMLNNFWTQKGVPMGEDKLCYQTRLTPQERSAYDKALAFASNLDGIQFNNLISNIGQHITAPEVSLVIARQAAEEGLHVVAYQTMVQSVSLDPVEVYMMFERDGMLAAKNEYIMRQSDVLKDDPTPANFARAIVANIILEGIYFYSAFLTFYILARNGKMLSSADMIKYIQRDEGGTHLTLFTNLHHTFKQENPHLYDEKFWADAKKMFMEAVDLEEKWGHYMIQGGFPGATREIYSGFLRCLANERWEAIQPGDKLYRGVVNPAPWFNDYSKVNGTRTNFFEGKPVDYSVAGLEW